MYNGSLVVTSGYTNLKTTQLFDAGLKQWKYVAATNKLRAYHALVAAEGSLFAIGSWNVKSKQSASSGKRWADLNGQWREVHFMNTPRCLFAAVVCQGFINAIGDYSTKTGKTVKKYDIGNKVNNT